MTQDHRARQAAAIEQWLKVFCLPGQVVELRALRVQGKKAVCEVHQDLHQLASRAAELDGLGAQGCYFTPNPLKPELAGWKDSRIKAEDILCRHWLLIDCDSDKSRPTGTNATLAEKEAGWKVLDRCVGLLHAAGLRNAVIGDSGNGWHLCYPVDMPNDEASQEVMKVVLAGLAKRCGDDQATVTLSTHDAPRIWKLYGTLARKGEHTPERPHRWSRLISGTPWEQGAAQANTKALRALPGHWQAADDLRNNRPGSDPLSAMERARKYVATMPAAVSGQDGHKQTYEVAQVLARGFALPRSESWPLLCEYNTRCQPPWSEKELQHKIESAEKDSRLPVGYLLQTDGKEASNPAQAAPQPERKIVFPEPIPASQLKATDPNRAWLWKGYLAPAEVTLFSALWKAGKTTLLAHLLRALESDGQFLGMDVRPSRVLYITEEAEARWAERRDRLGLKDHLEFLIRPFQGKPSKIQWEDFLGYSKTLIDSRGYGLIVMDTIVNLWPVKDENDASSVQSSLMPLHSVIGQSALLLVHHTRKSDGFDATASRGSGALTSFVDTILEFRRMTPGDRHCKKRVLAGYGRHDETIPEVVIELTDNGYTVCGDREAVASSELTQVIATILPAGSTGLTAEQILEQWPGDTKPNLNRFYAALKAGAAAGTWHCSGEGKRGSPRQYRLASEEV